MPNFMVCWLTCLQDCNDMDNSSHDLSFHKFYMIEAKNKKIAVDLFLRKMACDRLDKLGKDYIDDCITNMVRGIYRYGKLECLNGGMIHKDFAYEANLVATGNYYNPEIKQGLSEEDADILGIIKEIDTDPISEVIDTRLYIEVFLETYRYDVAVIAVKRLGIKTFCSYSVPTMTNCYMVCWKDNIENLINDDEVFYNSSNRLSESDVVNYVVSDAPEEAIRQYLLISVRDAYLKKANWLHIKKRCAARIVRRIVADEVHLLPQQVLLSGCYDTIAAMVYNCIEKAPMPLTDNTKKEFFNYLAGNLDISGIAAWIDPDSTFELYVEIFSKDVIAHRLMELENLDEFQKAETI